MRFLKEQYPQYNIGDYTYGVNIIIYDWHENSTLKIGKFCSIGEYVVFMLGGNHYKDRITTYPLYQLFYESINKDHCSKGDIIIQNDVWIGNISSILSGITISNGAIIGANSVVTKDIPPYHIVAGNPAKIIGQRFSDKEIETLLEVQWWNWPIKKIRKNIRILCGKDINEIQKAH